jgi:hypothetical protein
MDKARKKKKTNAKAAGPCVKTVAVTVKAEV